MACIETDVTYDSSVPKLWNETIAAHREAVREAILDTTAALAAAHGVRSVTMSQIAEDVGIGRATLYKYFPDVDSILRAWHDRQIDGHLGHLAAVRDRGRTVEERLVAVLHAYAGVVHQSKHHHQTELAAFLHQDEQVGHAEQHLRGMLRDLLSDAAETGVVRSDVAPEELATFCMSALDGARTMPSQAAVRRLVTIVEAGLRSRG